MFYQFRPRFRSIMSCLGLPYFARGRVINGYGRGSKELGIPTANFSLETVKELPETLKPGVYFGWAKIDYGTVYKMVMSIGWNPFYKNKEKSMEVHIMNEFPKDFYGCTLSIIILDYIRPEKDFNSIEELKQTIFSDIEIAKQKLNKPEFLSYQNHQFFNMPFEKGCSCT